jgi:DNA-binding NarL/FixJ family response regulator
LTGVSENSINFSSGLYPRKNPRDHRIDARKRNLYSGYGTMPIRILLADDHALIRQGLRALLEKQGFQIVCEASDGQEVLRSVMEAHPDVAIVDISMPVLNGVDTARELKKCSPKTKVILLTQHDEEQYVTESLRAGVKGYVLKSQAGSELIHAIQEVCRGSVYLSPNISRAVVDAYLSKSYVAADRLSGRERQVLQLVGEGKSTKDIATRLGISVKTAESHRARLMKKLDIHETASLVRYAIRNGLIQP